MKIWLLVISSEMNPVCSFMLALFKLRLAGRTDVGGDIVLWWDKSDLHSPFLTHMYTYIHTHTQSTHLCFSHRSEIAPCSPLMREVGEVVRNGQKRQRNARKGESWPLGLAEASSVSEGAGGWTKWLIHFLRDPLPPPSLCTHTYTPFPLWMGPVIQVLASAEMASIDPEGAQFGWKVTAESSHCLSMCVFGCEDHRRSLRKYGRHWALPDLLSFFHLLTTGADQEKGDTEVCKVQMFRCKCAYRAGRNKK